MSDYNIGNIYAELSMDTTNLEVSKKKAIKELGNLRDEGEKILKEAGGNMTEAMKIRLEEIEKNKSEILKIIDTLNKNIKEKLNPLKEALGMQIEDNFIQPMKAFASTSIETFTHFQQSMQNTFSVMGASSADMKLLEETAKKMGETTRFSASQASQALYSLGSAGQSATEAVNSLQGVLQLAGATGSDLAYTSETIASTLSQFNLEASKASHIADVYAKAISKSQASMTKLSYSMKYVGPVASGLGISLETTTAALMKLYNTGYGGEQAGTYLKQAFQKLASGTNELKTKLQELGISYEDVNPQTRNFADIINTLKEKNIGVTESIDIFGETAGGAMAKLIEEGGEAISTMEGLLKASEGAAAEMQDIQNASFANTKAELASAMEALQITTGSILEPALNTLAVGFTEVLKSVNNLPIGVQTFITTMLTASTAIVPFLKMPAIISRIEEAMKVLNGTMLHNPIFIAGAVISGVAAISYAFYQSQKKHNEEMIQDATKGAEDIKAIYKKAQEAGEKGRNIQELLTQYETLKEKTNKTKEEQEAYNQTLKDLTKLVPGVVTGVSETGEAYIKNIEKIKTASQDQLKQEAELNAQAIVIARQRLANIKTVESLMANKIADTKQKRSFYGDAIKEAQDLAMKVAEAKLKGEEEVDKILKDKFGDTKYDWNIQQDVETTPEERYKKYEEYVNGWLKTNERILKDEEETLKIQLEVQKAKNELEELLAKDTVIKNAKEPKKEETPKQSKDEILIAYEKQRKDTLNKLKKEQKEKRKQINLLDEEEKLLMQQLEKLIDMDVSKIKEGEAFSSDDKGIQKIVKRIDEIRALRAKEKEVNKTQNEKDDKSKEEDLPISFMQAVEKKYEEKREELKDTLYKIKSLQEEITSLQIKGDDSEANLETIKYYDNLIKDLESKAQSLSAELGQSYVVLDDIDRRISELDQKDTNTFSNKFKAIEAQKTATIKAIEEAHKAGNIDEATASKKKKEITNVALKSTVTVGAELSKVILNVGNNVTDIILGAIEKGTLSLSDGLNLVNQIAGQLANIIPDPMTKAVLGAVQMGINLINKIIHYAENVKKGNEEAYNKAMEEDDKKRQQKARMLAGDTADFYAKQMSLAKKGANNFNTILSEMANKVKDNALSDAIKTLGEAKTTQLTDAWIEREKTEWYKYKDKFGNELWWYGKHMVGSWEKVQMSINELIIEWKKAVEKGDQQQADKLKKALEEGAKEHFKKKGVNYEEINNLKNYMQGIEEAFVGAIKQKDFGALKEAMREKIRDAMLSKLQQTIIFSKLAPLLKKLEDVGESQKEKIINEINEEMEKSYNNYEKYATKFLGNLGLVSTELEEHKKAWRGLKNTITEALSNTLGEAAYNADWGAFKKAFANEMKKAIISSAVANAGLKTKIDSIIKEMMKDGKITAEEINSSVNILQDYFDELEGKLAPLAKMTNVLEKGVDVKSEHGGTIIQQLSGADRDFFAEEFRKNFASMGDSFKSAMIDLKEIHQAKITVEMATLSVHDIYINAGGVEDLKSLIAELIEEARRAG